MQSFDELLRLVAGVNLNARGAFGAQTDIGIRGSTFSQVLVLVDGLRLNDPLTGHFSSYLPVPISEIDRIEIIRGGAVSSFGADAVGGVVHIHTKTFETRDTLATRTSGTAAYGEFGMRQLDGQVTFGRKHLTVSGAFRNMTGEGEARTNPNFNSNPDVDSLYQPFFDLQTYTVAAAYRPSERVHLAARVGYDERTFNAKYFYTRSSFDESVESVTNLWTQLNARGEWDRHCVDLNLGWKALTDAFVFNPLFTPNEHETEQYTGVLTHTWGASDRWEILEGVQWLSRSILSSDRGDHQTANIAGFVEAHGTLLPKLKATASARVEYDQNFGTEFIPSLALSYAWNKWTLRTSYNRSVRAADFTERFVGTNLPDTLSSGRNLGNPNLGAERSNAWDIGADFRNGHGLSWSTSFFYRSATNLIDYALVSGASIASNVPLQDGGEYFYAGNVSRADVLGVETDLGWVKSLGEDTRLHTRLTYTWLQTEGGTGTLSKYISNHPSHAATTTCGIGWKCIKLSLAASYAVRDAEVVDAIDGQIPADYVLVQGRLDFRLEKSGALFINAFNLTDEAIQEVIGAPLPGRWWSAGVSWDFRGN